MAVVASRLGGLPLHFGEGCGPQRGRCSDLMVTALDSRKFRCTPAWGVDIVSSGTQDEW